jgi:hypothetical protein
MFKSKAIRTSLILIGIVVMIILFILPLRYPSTIDAALITPPPRNTQVPPPPRTTSTVNPPGNDGGGGTGGTGGSRDKGGGSDTLFAGIYGQVIDLSTGQPGRGLEIRINDSILRTDSDGRYSLTGLGPGSYTAVLQLPDGATAGPQSSAVVYVAEKQTMTLDLTFYSQLPPTPTPTNTPEPTPLPPTTEAAAENEAAPAANIVSSSLSPLIPFAGGSPAVWINPGYINNEEGVNGNIAIDVANVSDFGAFQATLKFNPKIIEVEDVVLGNFLDSTGRQTNPLVTEVDNTSGEISFVAYTSGDVAGPNGGGTLAVVTFASKQAGVSDLKLDSVLLVARLGKKIDAAVGDGQINVTACLGDLNGDEVIDISDVQAVAGRAGQAMGDPNYIADYDVNNDSVLDEADVTAITSRLYESCP